MHRKQVFIQHPEFFQICDGALAVAALHLVDLPVSLLQVEHELFVAAARLAVHAAQQLRGKHIRCLHAEAHGDSAVFRAFKRIVKRKSAVEFFFAHHRVERIKPRFVVGKLFEHFIDHLGHDGACPHGYMVAGKICHVAEKVIEGGGACFHGLKNCKAGADRRTFPIQFIIKRPEPALHPGADVLRKAAQQAEAGVDVRVDQARQNSHAACVDLTPCVSAAHFLRRANRSNLSILNSKASFFNDAEALALHRNMKSVVNYNIEHLPSLICILMLPASAPCAPRLQSPFPGQ